MPRPRTYIQRQQLLLPVIISAEHRRPTRRTEAVIGLLAGEAVGGELVAALVEDDVRRRRVDQVVAVLAADGAVAPRHFLCFERWRGDGVADQAAVAVALVGLGCGGRGGRGGGRHRLGSGWGDLGEVGRGVEEGLGEEKGIEELDGALYRGGVGR